MAYTEAQKQAAVDALIRQMPNLNRTVAYQWVTSEQGSCNNILGVTSSSGHCSDYSGGHQGCVGINRLCSFDSFDAAARAARSLIYGSSVHRDLRNAIVSGSGVQQAQALVDSRWGGPAGWWPYFVRLYPYFRGQLKPPDHLTTKTYTPYVLNLAKRYPELKDYKIIQRMMAGENTSGGKSGGGGSGSGSGSGSKKDMNTVCSDPATTANNGAIHLNAFSRTCFKRITGITDESHVITQDDIDNVVRWLQGAKRVDWGTDQNISQYVNYVFWQMYAKRDAAGLITTTKISDLNDEGLSDTSGNPLGGTGVDISNALAGLGDVFLFLGVILIAVALIIAAALISKQQGAGSNE